MTGSQTTTAPAPIPPQPPPPTLPFHKSQNTGPASPQSPPAAPHPRVTFAHVKYFAWTAACIVFVGAIYLFIVTEGIRLLMPVMAQKIHKQPIPGLALLGQYQETRRLDLAIFFALFLFCAVWYSWHMVIRTYFSAEPVAHHRRWKPESYKRLLLCLAGPVLAFDCIVFYCAMIQLGWGGNRLSVTALLGTAAYMAILVFITIVSENLRPSTNSR